MTWGRIKAWSLAGEPHPRQGVAARARSGFSFIELLVVVALILVLTTLYWGSGADKRQQRLQVACQENLRRIHMALSIYANDFSGKFPETPAARSSDQALNLLVPRYTIETALFICPAAKAVSPPGETLLDRRLSYAYYMGRRATEPQAVVMTDGQAAGSAPGTGAVLFSISGKAPGNNHGARGGNVLFTDGHVEWSAARAPLAIAAAPGVVRLNPKP